MSSVNVNKSSQYNSPPLHTHKHNTASALYSSALCKHSGIQVDILSLSYDVASDWSLRTNQRGGKQKEC
jgi:hypothetical protein